MLFALCVAWFVKGFGRVCCGWFNFASLLERLIKTDFVLWMRRFQSSGLQLNWKESFIRAFDFSMFLFDISFLVFWLSLPCSLLLPKKKLTDL